ncbi:molecular chaperone TorD family protein [Pseudodesulfovibrio sp. zrk46]|uniref:TorD/DmsD family molecular chaperone n=1 Tax=Pseudodesulfovibrio sp. zrk46 TaxID=2725288 RepID=UPI001449BDA0|nr:molecular chaperone TorD family protein [Pseudodesulfovibrio sp. zrk46]QJB55952.1 TorD-like chaperone [Pseudodesulfovibrio sp. zrk46]
MSDLKFIDTDERVFILNNIELLATIFHGPDAGTWVALIDAGVPELMARASGEADDLTRSLKNLQATLPASSDSVAMDDLETEYVRLFVAGQGGVVAPLYQSCHQDTAARTMGDTALAMQERLNECGLELSLDSNEPPDHVALELEYLYHLLVTAWTEDRSELEQTAIDFARIEMLPWMLRFQEALSKGEPNAVYVAATSHALAVLKKLAA